MSSSYRVRYSYLREQFADPAPLLERVAEVVRAGDFTLGRAVREFEARFAGLLGSRHAVGVGSGTDALKLPLHALGVGAGDEVITNANTFIATAGAICELGARPVLVDCDDSFCIDAGKVEDAIGPRTKALMPVHLTGGVSDMETIAAIASRRGVPVVEDACQAILARHAGRCAGTFGAAAGFSLHPLKNLNVWGDAGVIVTDDDRLAEQLRLLRNHGLAGRDEVRVLGYNSRLDTIQAVVANELLDQVPDITARRVANAHYYDAAFATVDGVRVPPRSPAVDHVFHLYILFAEDRDALLRHCHERGIEAKIHYPVPLCRQPALARFGYAEGDFPVAERHAREMVTLPVDQHLDRSQLDLVIETVREFYASRHAARRARA